MRVPIHPRFARARRFPAVITAITLSTCLFMAPMGAPPTAQAWTPMSPVSLDHGLDLDQRRTARGRLLGINDFHGALEPPIGSAGLVNGTPSGGVEYLATQVRRLRAQGEQDNRDVLTLGAGDLVGGSPLISAAFHDEPAVEAMNLLGLDLSSVGNHEFDEGTEELRRLQRGGCHPVDGCQDGDGFAGADFTYLAANVITKRTGLPISAPFTIRMIDGVPVGFVGMTLKATPNLVNPAGVTTVEFTDEIETANRYAGLLRTLGVRSLVLMIHEGGRQNGPPPMIDPSSCADFAGPITDIVRGLRPEYGVVISGHTHRFYSCALPNAEGGNTVVTSAGANATLVTSIDVEFDRRTGRLATVHARNVIAENGVRSPNGGWQTDDTGNPVRDPALADPELTRLVDRYRGAIAPIANKVIGRVSADITRRTGPAGESALGDVIADAQLGHTRAAGAQIALMNPGGLRADLTFGFSPGGEAPGEITYGEAFTVQPFNNLLITATYTGAALKDVLEQQFAGHQGQTVERILQVSAGFTYSYDKTAAAGSRVRDLALNGVPIDPAGSYRITANDFLANGGDGFSTLTAGTDRITAPGFDVDALTAHLGTGVPINPGPMNRVTRLG